VQLGDGHAGAGRVYGSILIPVDIDHSRFLIHYYALTLKFSFSSENPRIASTPAVVLATSTTAYEKVWDGYAETARDWHKTPRYQVLAR
jgi:hypothetical protein|tara:strand:- start:164 stop:430 length:267 start_codon:yes stop_codon:yes gene_type:complete